MGQQKPPSVGQVCALDDFWAKRLASVRLTEAEYEITVESSGLWYAGVGKVFKRSNRYWCEILTFQIHNFIETKVVLLGLLKDFYLDLAIRAAAELLIDKLILFKADHSSSYFGASRLDRFQKIAAEHSATVGRVVPLILEWVSDLDLLYPIRYESKMLFSLKERKKNFFVESFKFPVCIAIGPEGDFTIREEQTLLSKGFTPVTLGNTILSSWACVAVAAARLYGCDQSTEIDRCESD